MRLIVCFLLAFCLMGCSSRRSVAPSTPIVESSHTGYITLQPGWRLRVVTPILKSGGYRLAATRAQETGNTITVTGDFIGYETAYYAVKRSSRGRVTVEFLSAEVSRDGEITVQSKPYVRLFALPGPVRFVRLIYLTRVSHSDHDMAVLAARRRDTLEKATQQVDADPAGACKMGRGISCQWVPSGIAVRAEMRKTATEPAEWIPAR